MIKGLITVHFNPDPNVDHDSDHPQVKANQGECVTDPTHTDLINSSTIAPTDLDASNEEDHLQYRPNMSIKAWQDHEVPREDISAARIQNRSIQTTKQPPSCQPTLRVIERLAWCVFEHENLRDGIFGYEIRSQDSKIIRRVLKEPTRTVTRSYARLIFDNG